MISALTMKTPATAETQATSKLRKASQEFESLLIADLLKMADEGKPVEDGVSQNYDDMRQQAVASAMAANGGLGIAKMLQNQLLPSEQKVEIKVLSSRADSSIARDF